MRVAVAGFSTSEDGWSSEVWDMEQLTCTLQSLRST